jgi:hypothetical protein
VVPKEVVDRRGQGIEIDHVKGAMVGVRGQLPVSFSSLLATVLAVWREAKPYYPLVYPM